MDFEEFDGPDDLSDSLDELSAEFGGEFGEEFGDEFGSLAGGPDADPEEYYVTEIRTAVLKKKDLVALLCLKTANRGGAICRVDPREAQPSVQLYDDPEKAVEWYNKSLNTSKENGWQVVYDGLPLRG